ncbi:MAG TPA: BspA family leucine-rich repeat surface protein [Coriobacteriaceae bacterium]|nr:BspA family leucine-rich repeat surface protein [Coriobacteriaceae bacterium]
MIKRQSMEILRKLAACAFAVALVTSLVPAAAFANPAEPQVQPAEEVTNPVDPTPGPIAEGTFEGGNCTWSIGANGELSIKAPESGTGTLGNVYAAPWQDHAADIKYVFFGPGITSGQGLHRLFANCTSLVFVNFSDFDTSQATDMSSMFEGCTALPAVNIAGLNTQSVTNMQSMFKDCTALRSLTIAGINTASVKDMQSMFAGCSALKTLDLTGINTQSVINMQSMFAGCLALASLDLSGFNMTSVTAAKDMFSGCGSLVTLKLPALGMKGVTDMSGVFSGCAALESLDLTNIATASATTMARMFEDCAALATLDLSNFDTANVTDMDSMFAGCAALKTLNLSSFNTTNVTSMNSLFGDCEALTEVMLGGTFAFVGEASALPAGSWKSSDDGVAYTAHQIATERNGIESTYTREMTFTSAVPDETVFTYDGTAKTPIVVVKSGDRTLVEGTDYAVVAPTDAVNVGEKTLNIAGVGAYAGAAQTIDYEITPAAITDLTLDADKLTYDGTEQVPVLTVKAGELVLDPETDFDVATSDDITNIGTKTVKITAKGNFKGMLEMDYEIVAADIDKIELSADKFTYDGTDKTPAITVKAGDKTLVAGIDYELTLPTDRVTAGTKTVKAIAKGNYAGEVEASYEIAPATISKVELSATKFTYDGKDKTPTVTVKCGDKTLTAGTDYDVTLPSDRVKVGKKTIKVTGKGNYTGTLEANYEIVEAPKPDTPDTPDNPDNPDNPDTPDNPDKPAQVESTAMYRLYNPNSGEHFFTASTVERQHLISVGWNDEGQGWTAPKTGDAVYRLYNPNAGEHHYTLSTVERDSLIAAGWNEEGIGWYSDPNHAVPLYRVYNPNEFANNHHYTTNDFERGYLVALGWFGEGIAWYGIG